MGDLNLSKSFSLAADRWRDRIALVTDARSLTYGELDTGSDRVAGHFRRVESSPVPVVILVADGIDFSLSVWGLIKAGRIYVPLNPRLPAERLKTLVEDLGECLILTDRENQVKAHELGARVVLVFEELVGSAPESVPGMRSDPWSPTLIIYTSGSTGRPKGVVHNHAGILANNRLQVDRLELTEADRWAHTCSVGVVASVRGFYATLLSGGSLHFFSIEERGVHELPRWVESHRITIFHIGVSAFRKLNLAGDEAGRLKAIRQVILGGEASAKQVFRYWSDHFAPHCRLCVGYGSSETLSMRMGFLAHGSELEEEELFLPTGDAVSEKEILIVDEEGRRLPEGTVGEIVVESRYLALGYWNREDETSHRFKAIGATAEPEPSTSEDARRIYHTGDRGKLRLDGRLCIEGRSDSQVKINGNRVDMVEVERALEKLPNVKRAAVVCLNDEEGKAFLVGYFEGVDGKGGRFKADAAGVRSLLRGQLPSAMVPRALIAVDRFPETDSGKINRAALRARPLPQRSYSAAEASEAEMEDTMVVWWNQVLSGSELTRDDNVIAAGADSLAVIDFCVRVDARWPGKIKIADVYRHPSVTLLSQYLRGRGSDAATEVHRFGGSEEETPIFFAPGIERHPFKLNSVAENLAKSHPCFGLSLATAKTVDGQIESLSMLARQCVDQVLAVAPKRPLVLAGYSFGGLVAFETARHLRSQGCEVLGVVLFDVCLLKTARFLPEPRMPFAQRLGWSVRAFWRFPLTTKRDYLKFVSVEWLRRLNLAGPAKDDLNHTWDKNNSWIRREVTEAYYPESATFPGLLLTSGSYEGSAHLRMVPRWRKLIPELTIRQLPVFGHLQLIGRKLAPASGQLIREQISVWKQNRE